MGRRAQGTVIIPWGVQSPGTLRDSCNGALETGHLSHSLSLSMGALLGEPGVWVPLLGVLKVAKGRP